MDLLKAFGDFSGSRELFPRQRPLLLAVSGGLDSVVLCKLCAMSGLDFEIAHCNFRLRGAESARDEQFVRDLGNQYNKPVRVRGFDTEAYASERKISIQVAARELRYEWFGELAVENGQMRGHNGQMRIVTAHHLDDNIETLLMNFFKGTGMQGLKGILPLQGNIARPLLFATKEELQQFAAGQNLQWVEDSSNVSDKYTRNYFRHQLIPLVEKVYPGALQNLGANLDRFRGAGWFYSESINRYKNKLLEKKGNEIHIPILKLKKILSPGPSGPSGISDALPTLVFEIIRDFGFSPAQVPEIIRLLDSSTGRRIDSATHRILKNRNWLIVSPHPSMESGYILIESPDTVVQFEQGELRFQKLETVPIKVDSSPQPAATRSLPGNSPGSALLDASSIRWPLLLRRWKPGDYFYPLGMRKKKKLARFFIDQKLSGAEKEKIWVLEMDKTIVWIVGHRIDDRFRVQPSTGALLKIDLRKF